VIILWLWGKTNQFNQSRILAQAYQQMDAQKSAKDYDNMEPKTFMAMMVATLSKQCVQFFVSFCRYMLMKICKNQLSFAALPKL
jgi:hypothetical protein